MSEEFDEVCAAEEQENLLKELCDVLYVTYGYAITFGWDLDEAFRRVHASNMSKLDDDGNPIVRSDGKVMKGPNYQEPDLGDLV
jgi:predicted HAD superfamily Cof-like phosphohydrolase